MSGERALLGLLTWSMLFVLIFPSIATHIKAWILVGTLAFKMHFTVGRRVGLGENKVTEKGLVRELPRTSQLLQSLISCIREMH